MKTKTIQSVSNRPRTSLAGFSIVELLVALAITSLVLVAVAVAFNASIINYRQNEDIFESINSARGAVLRMTTQLRTANAVEPNAPSNQCSLITADGEDITYHYNSSDNKLYLVTNSDTSDPDYVLCSNVTAMTFTNDTATDEGVTYVKSVQISITVAVGTAQQKVSAAAVIRRNLQ